MKIIYRLILSVLLAMPAFSTNPKLVDESDMQGSWVVENRVIIKNLDTVRVTALMPYIKNALYEFYNSCINFENTMYPPNFTPQASNSIKPIRQLSFNFPSARYIYKINIGSNDHVLQLDGIFKLIKEAELPTPSLKGLFLQIAQQIYLNDYCTRFVNKSKPLVSGTIRCDVSVLKSLEASANKYLSGIQEIVKPLFIRQLAINEKIYKDQVQDNTTVFSSTIFIDFPVGGMQQEILVIQRIYIVQRLLKDILSLSGVDVSEDNDANKLKIECVSVANLGPDALNHLNQSIAAQLNHLPNQASSHDILNLITQSAAQQLNQASRDDKVLQRVQKELQERENEKNGSSEYHDADELKINGVDIKALHPDILNLVTQSAVQQLNPLSNKESRDDKARQRIQKKLQERENEKDGSSDQVIPQPDEMLKSSSSTTDTQEQQVNKISKNKKKKKKKAKNTSSYKDYNDFWSFKDKYSVANPLVSYSIDELIEGITNIYVKFHSVRQALIEKLRVNYLGMTSDVDVDSKVQITISSDSISLARICKLSGLENETSNHLKSLISQNKINKDFLINHTYRSLTDLFFMEILHSLSGEIDVGLFKKQVEGSTITECSVNIYEHPISVARENLQFSFFKCYSDICSSFLKSKFDGASITLDFNTYYAPLIKLENYDFPSQSENGSISYLNNLNIFTVLMSQLIDPSFPAYFNADLERRDFSFEDLVKEGAYTKVSTLQSFMKSNKFPAGRSILGEYEKKISDQKNEYTKLQSEILVAQEQIQSDKKAAKELRSTIDKKQKELDLLNSKYAQLQQKNNDITYQLKELNELNSTNAKSISENQKLITSLTTQNANINAQLTKSQNSAKQMSDSFKQKDEENKALKSKNTELNSQLERLKLESDKTKKLMEEKDKKILSLQAVEKDANSLKTNNSNLINQIEQLKTQTEEHKKLLEEKEKKIVSLQAVNSEISLMITRIDEISKDLSSKAERLEAIRQDKESLKAENIKLQEELEKQKADALISSLHNVVNKEISGSGEIQPQPSSSNSARESLLKELLAEKDSQIAGLNSQLASANYYQTYWQSQHSLLNQSYASVTKELQEEREKNQKISLVDIQGITHFFTLEDLIKSKQEELAIKSKHYLPSLSSEQKKS